MGENSSRGRPDSLVRTIAYAVLLAEILCIVTYVGVVLFLLAALGDCLERFLAIPTGTSTSALLQIGVGHPTLRRPYVAGESVPSSGTLEVLEFGWVEVVVPEALIDRQGRVVDTWVTALGVDMGRPRGCHLGLAALWWIAIGLPPVVPRRARCWLALLVPLVLAQGGLGLVALYTIALILWDPPLQRHEMLLLGGPFLVSCVLLGYVAAAWIAPALLFHVIPVSLIALGGLAVGLVLARWCLMRKLEPSNGQSTRGLGHANSTTT